MVRSAHSLPIYFMRIKCSFNSTMVRSAHPARLRAQPRWHMFQFHDGSISTARTLDDCLRICDVSIPRWFDQHLYENRNRKHDEIVSIPRWFDQHDAVPSSTRPRIEFQFHDGSISTTPPRELSPLMYAVSIPRWFDQHPQK